VASGELSARLAGLFPPGVLVRAERLDEFEPDPEVARALLAPEERPAVARAVPVRVREFALGRVLARGLLRDLGRDTAAIPAGEDRAPRWPAGTVGTISHSRRHGAAAVADEGSVTGVGLDTEPAEPLEESLWREVLRPEELRALEEAPAVERGERVRVAFAAKEAAYKLQYPRTRRFLEFGEMRLELDLVSGADEGAFVARPDVADLEGLPAIRGRLLRADGAWFAACSWPGRR
jgi:4'-phosphopantetheinyl transferase EntD